MGLRTQPGRALFEARSGNQARRNGEHSIHLRHHGHSQRRNPDAFQHCVQYCCRQRIFPLNTSDVGMSFLPLSHVFERVMDFYCFWAGVSIAYAESFEMLPQNLREVRPTVMAVVPRVLEKIREKVMDAVRKAPAVRRGIFHWAMKVGSTYYPMVLDSTPPPRGLRIKHHLADKLIYSKVRDQMGGKVRFLISGAAPLALELAEFFFSIGLPVYEGYGLTETSPVISANAPGRTKLGTVGLPIPGVEVKFGEEMEDESGGSGREILVKGPNVMPGYYHMDDETRAVFIDGWFRTGDLGAMDSDGYLKITGRKKNLFKTSGGKYVAPEKLENLFQGHLYVQQIMVMGDARRFVGALVVPHFARLEEYARLNSIGFEDREGLVKSPVIHSFMQQQVDDACQWLAPHERIRQIVLLPREFTIASGELSSTLKIKRPVVETRYKDLIEEMFSRKAAPSEAQPVPPT